MILSGLLMYGSSQKNKLVGHAFFAALVIYLLATSSTSTMFFMLNIATILVVSMVLRTINCHVLKGAAILVYSVLIDILSFYLFPQWIFATSLSAYITAGLLFNLRSAIPALVLGFAVQLFIVKHFVLRYKNNKVQIGQRQALVFKKEII